MSSEPTDPRTDSEKKKFRDNGSGDTVIASQLYGETAAGAVIPFKVTDDGSSLGKVVAVVE